MDNTVIDLSKLTVSEACHWLLHSLNVNNFLNHPYTIPFSSYVMTWERSVPLNTIIIGQNPYPNNIFSPIAAAMSYDTDLCQKTMSMQSPPTVTILANDLFIHAGFSKQDTINIVKNGWALVDKGVLLINEAVFYGYQPEESYIEASIQCSVIIRLLQETERYGKRTVNIYAMGEAGQRVASDICSWYKSSKVTLSKRAATHPAAVSRRFNDFNHPDCHMGTPSFSKSLAKCFSNYVAYMHTMSKKTEKDIRVQRLSDTLKSAARNFPDMEKSMNVFVDAQRELSELPNITDENYKNAIAKVISAADDFTSRLRISTSIINSMQSFGGSISANVSKPAPSIKTDTPSKDMLEQHTGQEVIPAVPIVATASTSFKPSRKRISSAPTEASSYAAISSPPSISSIITSNDSPQVLIKPSRRRVSGTPIKRSGETPKPSPAPTEDDERSDIVSPLQSKYNRKVTMPKSVPAFNLPSRTKYNPKENTLTTEQINHLSSVEAVVQMHREDVDKDDDCQEYFNNIQNDIKAKTVYNTIVRDLVDAINKDMDNIPNFDFSDWCGENSTHSETFEVCKDRFEFN
jgi:hypothetical protein